MREPKRHGWKQLPFGQALSLFSLLARLLSRERLSRPTRSLLLRRTAFAYDEIIFIARSGYAESGTCSHASYATILKCTLWKRECFSVSVNLTSVEILSRKIAWQGNSSSSSTEDFEKRDCPWFCMAIDWHVYSLVPCVYTDSNT